MAIICPPITVLDLNWVMMCFTIKLWLLSTAYKFHLPRNAQYGMGIFLMLMDLRIFTHRHMDMHIHRLYGEMLKFQYMALLMKHPVQLHM
jgi:hypothetical protein